MKTKIPKQFDLLGHLNVCLVIHGLIELLKEKQCIRLKSALNIQWIL